MVKVDDYDFGVNLDDITMALMGSHLVGIFSFLPQWTFSPRPGNLLGILPSGSA